MVQKKSLIAVKIGSNVITGASGFPDEEIISGIAGQIRTLRDAGHAVILISSGAVAAGRSLYQFSKKTDTVVQRQVLASIGQIKLISMYREAFAAQEMICAQVLVTREDFKDRHHYLNMRNCLHSLLANGITPILNENDVVSVTELMFTDNDELAGLVSAMMNTDLLVILTNVDGIYDGDPGLPGSAVIDVFDSGRFDISEINTGKKSGFGRGGIVTKCLTAEKISGIGIPVHIANGKKPDMIIRIVSGERVGTRFPPRKLASSFKKYMAHAYQEPRGQVVINDGAVAVLQSDRAHSLLPIGITGINGGFRKGDLIRVIDEKGNEIGLGLARYDDKKAKEVMGQKNQKALIHYDHLYLH